MCGIAGILGAPSAFNLFEGAKRMAISLSHRGPDDEGIWIEKNQGLALVHRRLSIIDVSVHGHQPMHSKSGRYVLVFNGEIYNFQEIRELLEVQQPLNYSWRGHSDTEILLEAIESWGLEQAIKRINGMYAFALWDKESLTLSLARDRLGEKPLYYGVINQGIVFASELTAIEALCQGVLDIDLMALSKYMQFGYVPAPLSIYKNIGKLLPGNFIQIRNGEDIGQPKIYWSLDESRIQDSVMYKDSEEDIINKLHNKLIASVKSQMIADVPLGAFLSGGIDSSLIVSIMQSHSEKKIQTFTIGFDDKKYNEAKFAKSVANYLKTEHTELYVNGEAARNIVPLLAETYDEPFADSSQIPTLLLSQLTQNHVKVALSGDGGDEIFAGYNRYRFTINLWGRLSYLPLCLRKNIVNAVKLMPLNFIIEFIKLLPYFTDQNVNEYRLQRFLRLVESKNFGDVYMRLISQWQPEDNIILNSESMLQQPAGWENGHESLLNQLRKWDVHYSLADDILVKVDRAAMSVGLETRAPFLDHRIVEFAFSLPENFLFRDNQSKWILRKILDKYVPKSLIDRPKVGFGVPLGEWLRGPLRNWAESMLDPVQLRKYEHFDLEKIRFFWDQHQSGLIDRSPYLWNVIVFQSWYEARINRYKLSN